MKLIALVLFIVSGYVHAESKRIDVIVGVSDGFPVYYFDKQEQVFKGPMIESFEAICREANFNCIFRALPKKRIETELIEGSIHFGTVINSASQAALLKEMVYFTEFNVPASLGIYSTLPSGEIPEDLEAYYGESIICVLGWSLSVLPGIWEAEKVEHVTIFKPSTIDAAVRMLKLNRSKFLYANKQKMDVYITEQDGLHYKEFKSLNQTFGLSLASPQYQQIKQKVDTAISTLLIRGVIDPVTGHLAK
ncbi:hypothetical protein [Vibrio paucivorans]